MAKKVRVLLLIMILAVVGSACSSKTEQPKDAASQSQPTTDQQTQTKRQAQSGTAQSGSTPSGTSQSGTSQSAPAKQQAPATQAGTGSAPAQAQAADLMGEVTAVSSGKVELKLVKMPTPGAGGPPQGGTAPTGGAAPSGGTASAPSQPSTSSQPPSGSQPAPSQPPAQGQPSGEGKTLIQRGGPLEYTGETKTLSIPAGMKMTTITRTADSQTPTETAVSELKVGDVIQVWFSDSAKTVVSKVVVMRRTVTK